MKYTLLLLFLLVTDLYLMGQVCFYIAPTGNDLNQGTKEEPLASLIGARDAIREYKKKYRENISFTVYVADGFYWMDEPLLLNHKDSGTADYPIVYKAEEGATPIFSGGKEITGFKVDDDGVWRTKVHESRYYNWRFDQLFINDKRSTLARSPNNGFFKIGRVEENIWEKGSGRVAEKAQQILTMNVESFAPLEQLSKEELELLRFRAYHKWDFTIRHIDELHKDSMALITSGKGMKPWNPLKNGGRIRLENYAAALDAPGEWFLDQEGIMSYIPLSGQIPENTEVIAPALDNLITVEGDLNRELYVEHIEFIGLAFRHSGYQIPQDGFEPNQAAVKIPAAIHLEGARKIKFYNCEISHTGQHALWFARGCSYSVVRKCYIHDLGGGGIYLGDTYAEDTIGHTHHIKLENNIIQTGGQEFTPAVGIWVGHSSDNEIIHNDIANFFYTGISVGWVWGYKPSLAKNNKIKYNHIHHIGWDLLSDMAAVYTLGKSEGTEVSNNVIHDIHAYSYGGWGLYTDEGSSDILMENNLVYNTKTGGFHQHYGENNIIRNNIFAYAKMYQLQCTRVENHRSFDFRNNIVVFDKGSVLNGAWDKINIIMDKNLYWNTGGNVYDFNGKAFKEWQKSGHDAHSYVKNPHFIDAPNLDFRFKNKDNIEKINFILFDYSKSGVYGEKEWKDKAQLSNNILQQFNEAVDKNLRDN